MSSTHSITSYNRAAQTQFEALTSPAKSKNSFFDDLLDSASSASSVSAISAANPQINFNSTPFGNLGAILGFNDSGLSITSTGDLYPASLNNRAALEAIIGSSGPLPSYLKLVSSARNFTQAQTQGLYEVTAKNMNIGNSLDDIANLRQQLKDAGVPV